MLNKEICKICVNNWYQDNDIPKEWGVNDESQWEAGFVWCGGRYPQNGGMFIRTCHRLERGVFGECRCYLEQTLAGE